MPKNTSDYSVEFSPQALDDIIEIKTYIRDHLSNPISAERVVKEIFADCERLATTHTTGIKVSKYTEVPNDFRFILSGNYSVFYYTVKSSVKVVRVLYSRCDFLAKLFDK